MRWEFAIQQKLKVALLLAGIMLLVLLFNVLERRNIAAINQSVTSIYKDRLVPATDIFYLTEKLYYKRFEIERLLTSDWKSTTKVKHQLLDHNKGIEDLIRSFEKTYLVDKETQFLNQLRSQITSYNLIEQKILANAAAGDLSEAKKLYEHEGKALLMDNIRNLSVLAKIQTDVGNELKKDSEGILATSDMLSNIQMILVIIIGIMIVSLISISKALAVKQDSFNLN
ncbi:MCP four helix bundle domain-containing protein [Desertivirga arenae]|uniref:MCP four helix bundle domain-containing protein n=1 Tax=Desertivirga arenae TaxID=2810309 RepID=UPI001A9673EC|nr:MCP four helix bundle domain-containing protein [Pedobacter sp. SYSU D00823]